MKGSSFKRKLINARRVFVTGAHSFLRNTWLSVAATVVMTITLACILVTFFASYTLNNTVKSFTEKIDVSIFFKTDATKEQIDDVSAELRNDQNLEVKEITYISKEDARAGFEEQNKDDIKTLQAIAQAKDAFPASIRVKTIDTNKLQEVVKVTRQEKFKAIVDKDSYKDDAKRTAAERLGNVAKFLRNGGLIFSVIFGVISILVILNTIRMTIFNRKDEIEIMQLIGASRWYIRGPFIIEAAIYGAVAGVTASLLFFVGALTQVVKLQSYVEEVSVAVTRFNNLIWLIIPATVAIGMMIGAFSSYLAIRKHLKIKAIK
jgi:cell division transport system permease protein